MLLGTPRPAVGWCHPRAGTPVSSRQAFSNFYHTFHFLNLTSGQPLATANATVWDFCRRPWKEVRGSQATCWASPRPPWAAGTRGPHPGQCGQRGLGSHPAPLRTPGVGSPGGGPPLTCTCWAQVEATWPGQKPWLRDHCASALYILTLLLDGYRFTEETWPSIKFRKQVPRPRHEGVGAPGRPACPPDLPCGPQAGGTDIGWTLGYMLNLTGMIPAEAPAQWRAESYGVWAASVAFMVLTLTAVLVAGVAQLFWPQD